MKVQGKFKFKGVQRKDGGTFVNDNGREIKYHAKYSFRVDETTENGLYERTFSVPLDSPLVKTLLTLKPYDDIIIDFELLFTNVNSNVRVIPVAIKNV